MFANKSLRRTLAIKLLRKRKYRDVTVTITVFLKRADYSIPLTSKERKAWDYLEGEGEGLQL